MARPAFLTKSVPSIADEAPDHLDPAGPTLDTGIERDILALQLADIQSSETQERDRRASVLALFKTTLNTALARAECHFLEGRLGGLEMARLIANIHDDVICALYDFTLTHIAQIANPTASEHIAICAVGGYGRGEMAPQSDVDLLFLMPDKKPAPSTEQITEYMLYILWDLGLKIGHATRTTDQCLTLAKSDQTILTAMLDLRFLCGEKSFYEKLHKRFRRDIIRGKGRIYIAEKLEERDKRHEREGNSRYVIEPNIKESKGGLRDLHVLYWIARYLDPDDHLNDPQHGTNYVERGLFDAQAAQRFNRAADFLWRARIHLHLLTRRPTEVLSFDHQITLARQMGYASGPIEEAVEKFMKEYFTNAREVGALTRIACAKLEAENALRLPKGLHKLLPGNRRVLKNTAFVLEKGRLNFADPMALREDPRLIMQIFETAGRRNLDIHPDALSAIDFRRNLIDDAFRRDPNVFKIFKKILLGARAPGATLRLMNDSGVLGRYLLEFGGIVARTQFNMHHAFTVDEHTLGLVGYLHDLEVGRLERENPVATELAKTLKKSERLTLYLACLLHDTGKGIGDQCIEGAKLARRAGRRLGLDGDMTETIAWLVRRHLDLSETAQRRDISDPQTIAEFGALVGSKQRLRLLFLLTIVDIRAVGPGIWNDWKGSLLRDLYFATQAFLDGELDMAPKARALNIQTELKDRLPEKLQADAARITDEFKRQYWLNFDLAALMRHARFFARAIRNGHDISVTTRLDRNNDITELWVLGRDRQGLFADITRAISAGGASIRGARLNTGKTKADKKGRVFNVFYLQNASGLAFGRKDPDKLERLCARVEQTMQGTQKRWKIPQALASRRADAIPIRSKVSFSDAATDDTTIIEIEGRDRPGLLHDLAACLRDENLSVLSAHIEVVGPAAIDAFYVRKTKGEAQIDSQRRKHIKKALMSVLKPIQNKDQNKDQGAGG